MNKDLYQTLNIKPSASFEEIREAYLQAKTTHSEENMALYSIMSTENLEDNISEIETAYKVLSNKEKRTKYHRDNNIEMTWDSSSSPTSINGNVEKRSIEVHNPKESAPVKESKIANLVANNKFALKYDADPIFEKEINDTADYTGEMLRRIREYKNVDIERMSEMTRISKSHIRNIESENYSQLPARVYTRGFVYQYAKCLKMNPDKVASSYMNRVDQSQSNK